MRITICDDDKLITFQLTEYLNEFFQNSGIEMPEVITYNCAEDLLADPARMDLVFLDIEMPGLNGIYAGNHLYNRNPETHIFVITSHMKYLDDAMRFHVFRYLSKPLDKDRLFRNLNDALTKYDVAADQITIKTADNFYKIALQDIIFAEVINRKVIIHTITAEYVSVFNFQYWTDILSADYFFQPHRCFIVNMYFVSRFDRLYIYLYHDRYKALLSRRKYAEFKDHYLRFIEMR